MILNFTDLFLLEILLQEGMRWVNGIWFLQKFFSLGGFEAKYGDKMRFCT